MIATTREWVSRHGWTIRRRCLKCGREKFEERENPAKVIRKEVLEIVKKEENVGKKGKCRFDGCDKQILAGGYCYRHYKEVNGHPYKGGVRNHKGGNIEMPEKNNQEPIPLFRIFLDPELLDKLTAAAKREYRTPELHAAWLIDKALQEKADDTYQSGSGRRGG